MPKSDDTPPPLRPFRFHGIEVLKVDHEEATCECPFGCGKSKLYVGLVDRDERHFKGGWRCQVCGIGGNAMEFIRQVHKRSLESTKDYRFLEDHRKIDADTLHAWGVCKSFITGEWLVPGFLTNGNIGNLSRYIKTWNAEKKKEVWLVIATPTLSQYPFAPMSGLEESRSYLDWCEGAWDAMLWWKALKDSGNTERNVLGATGCGNFQDAWAKYSLGKHVTFFFDNDHPRKQENGQVSQPGYAGTIRSAGIVAHVEESEKPLSVNYLHWGENGYDPELPDGYDVRDYFTSGDWDGDVATQLSLFLQKIRPVPEKWIEGKSIQRGSGKSKPIEAEKCTSWKQLVNQFKRAMSLHPNMEGALAVCMASIASVKYRGKGKLWIKLVSPAATGKTTILEPLIAARKYTVMESDFRGFYSAWNPEMNGNDGKDYSLAARLFDMTLITKDGDTILQSAYKETILSQARDLFDSSGAKSSNNAIKREYQGLLFTWILAGTNALRKLDTSELGQRFIDYCIMEKIEDEYEDNAISRAIHTELKNARIQSNCKVESTMDEDYLRATRMTIGYIQYLRNNEGLASEVDFPSREVTRCEKLAKFVAYMRARPSHEQKEASDREMGTRLAQQFGRLALYLAVVMNKKKVDAQVMKLVEKVAFDTARGRTLEIVKVLHDAKDEGLDLKGVASETKQISHEQSPYLEFLTKIEALEKFDLGIPSLARNNYSRWRLTGSFRKLYKEVMRGKS